MDAIRNCLKNKQKTGNIRASCFLLLYSFLTHIHEKPDFPILHGALRGHGQPMGLVYSVSSTTSR